MSQDIRRLLSQFLDELPVDQLDVVVAHHVENLTFQEIATALGRPLSTIHDRYQAGMRALRAALQRWQAKQPEGGALLLGIPLESLMDLERTAPHSPLSPNDVERLWHRYQQALGNPGPEGAPSSGPRRINLPRGINLFFTLPAIAYLLVGLPKAAAELADTAPLDRAPTSMVHAEVPATIATTGAPSPSSASASSSADTVHPAAPSSATLAPPAQTAALPDTRRTDGNVSRAERETLEKARSALILGNMQGAMKALGEHAQKHPGGLYARERDEMWIESLVGMGRTAEACQHAETFRRAYPRSPLPEQLDALCTGR